MSGTSMAELNSFNLTTSLYVTSDKSRTSVYHSPIAIAFSIVVGSVGVISNAFALVVIAKNKTLNQRISNLLIANQSVADLVSSVNLIAYSTIQDSKVSDDLGGVLLCKVWLSGGLVWGFLLTSTWNLMVLTIERYLSVVHPVWHSNNVTMIRFKFALVVICYCRWGSAC